MTNQEIKNLWGEELFRVFADDLDDEGWLTEDWAMIVDEKVSNWDEDFNDTNEQKEIFSLMYNIEFEYNQDKTKIRRVKS